VADEATAGSRAQKLMAGGATRRTVAAGNDSDFKALSRFMLFSVSLLERWLKLARCLTQTRVQSSHIPGGRGLPQCLHRKTMKTSAASEEVANISKSRSTLVSSKITATEERGRRASGRRFASSLLPYSAASFQYRHCRSELRRRSRRQGTAITLQYGSISRRLHEAWFRVPLR